MRKLVVMVGLAIALLTGAFVSSADAANLANGAKIFNANCAACHMGGNNVIIASKTLKKDALDKYGMNSLEAIQTQVTQGKNAMPSFKSRLTPEQIEDVAMYVLQHSQQGW